MEQTIARVRIGTRVIMGTDWPVEHVVYRNGPQDWHVAYNLCNGVPSSGASFKTRREALDAIGFDSADPFERVALRKTHRDQLAEEKIT